LRLYKVIAIVLIKLTLNFLIETSYDLSNIYIFDTAAAPSMALILTDSVVLFSVEDGAKND
jgi:hypothetical protein